MESQGVSDGRRTARSECGTRCEATGEGAALDGSWLATILAEGVPLLAAALFLALLAATVLYAAPARAGTGRPGLAGGMSRSFDRAEPGRAAPRAEPLREEEVLRIWLVAELGSRRFAPRLRARLAELGCDESLIAEGSGDDPNRRRQLRALIAARGVVWDHAWFERRWQRETLRVGDLVDGACYGPHPGWVRMSGGTRRPRDVALRCRAGLLDPPHTRLFEQIAEAYRQSPRLPSVILLAEPGGTLTAVEGHARLSGLALALLDGAPPSEPVEVVVGYAADRAGAESYLRKALQQALP